MIYNKSIELHTYKEGFMPNIYSDDDYDNDGDDNQMEEEESEQQIPQNDNKTQLHLSDNKNDSKEENKKDSKESSHKHDNSNENNEEAQEDENIDNNNIQEDNSNNELIIEGEDEDEKYDRLMEVKDYECQQESNRYNEAVYKELILYKASDLYLFEKNPQLKNPYLTMNEMYITYPRKRQLQDIIERVMEYQNKNNLIDFHPNINDLSDDFKKKVQEEMKIQQQKGQEECENEEISEVKVKSDDEIVDEDEDEEDVESQIEEENEEEEEVEEEEVDEEEEEVEDEDEGLDEDENENEEVEEEEEDEEEEKEAEDEEKEIIQNDDKLEIDLQTKINNKSNKTGNNIISNQTQKIGNTPQIARIRNIIHQSLQSYNSNYCKSKKQEEIEKYFRKCKKYEGTERYDQWGKEFKASPSKFLWLPSVFVYKPETKTYQLQGKLFEHLENFPQMEYLKQEISELITYFSEPLKQTHKYFKDLSYNLFQDYPDFDSEHSIHDVKKNVDFSKKIHAIVKISEMEIQPNSVYEGQWHVEGYSTDNILYSCLYVIEQDSNLTNGKLQFKRTPRSDDIPSDPMGHEQCAHQYCPDYEYICDRNKVIPLGYLGIKEDLMAIFPNQNIHRVLNITNNTDTPLKRKIIALFIVNHEDQPITINDVEFTQPLEVIKELRFQDMFERSKNKQTHSQGFNYCEH